MKFNIMSYTLFLFVIVLFFPSLIFAPWTEDRRPQPAPEGLRLTCPQWIEFNGFTLTDFDENIRLTRLRNIKLDKDATTYAAMYAFYISGQTPPTRILPEQFCYGISNNSNTLTYSFMTLKDQASTCPGWIYLYGFVEVNITNAIGYNNDEGSDIAFNIDYANNKILEDMNEASIWAYGYYKYITRWRTRYINRNWEYHYLGFHVNTPDPLKPSLFCAIMGIENFDEAPLKPFINTYGPLLTCKAWIYLYGFNDNLHSNFRKSWSFAYGANYNNYNIKIHDFARLYAKRIQHSEISDDESKNLTPLKFCRRFINASDSATYSFDYTHSTVSFSSIA